MKSKEDILDEFQDRYKISRSGLQGQYKQNTECFAFYAGDYMNYRDEMSIGRGSSSKIKQVSFNRVKPYVNAVVGFMAQERRKPDYQARIEDAQEQMMYSEYLNGLSDYVRENMNADATETQQDKDLMICGIGATDTAITLKDGYATRDPNGEIIEERVHPNQLGYDPMATATNLLDSRWVWRAKDFDIKDAMELLDEDEEAFENIAQKDNVEDLDFNPYGGIQDKVGFEFTDSSRQMVRIYFYQWFDIEPFYRVENPLLRQENLELSLALYDALSQVESDKEDVLFAFNPQAETLVITKDKKKAVKDIFKMFEIPFNPIKHKRKVYYTALISGNKVLDRFKSPSQQGYSIQFKTGDRDEVNNVWTGIVSSMRDPQRYYNKSLTELMLIIANNSRGGVMYEEDAIDNVPRFEAQWAKNNAAVRVNSGALQKGKIQPKAQPKMPNGYEEILQVSGDNLNKVTGIDDSFFGAIAGGNETAMLQRQRIKQATVTLAVYFDSLALYAKEQARLMMSFYRLLAESNDGALFRMTDQEGNLVYERISPDFFVDEYDIVIGEAPETPVQKEFMFESLTQLAQAMLAIGDMTYKQVYAAAIDLMPVRDREKNKIKKILLGEAPIDPAVVEQLQAQIEQLQGEQAQLASQKMIADISKTQADIESMQYDNRKKVEEIEQAALENDIMASKPVTEVNATI